MSPNINPPTLCTFPPKKGFCPADPLPPSKIARKEFYFGENFWFVNISFSIFHN